MFNLRLSRQVSASKKRAKRFCVKSALTVDEWKSALLSSMGVCRYCNNCVGVNELTIDHIIPLNKGGENTIKNITPACIICNEKKNDKYDCGIRFWIEVPKNGWIASKHRVSLCGFPLEVNIRYKINKLLHFIAKIEHLGVNQYVVRWATIKKADDLSEHWFGVSGVDPREIAIIPQEIK